MTSLDSAAAATVRISLHVLLSANRHTYTAAPMHLPANRDFEPASAISGTSRQKFPTRITSPHIRAYLARDLPLDHLEI